MRLKERSDKDIHSERRDTSTNDTSAAENLQSLRSQGEHFINACDDAISKALSGDSSGFLARSRQEGGQ